MPLQIPSDMYQCKIRFRLAGDPQEMISTIGLRNNEPGERVITSVARAVYEAWAGAFDVDFLNSDYALVGVDASQGGGEGDGVVGSHDEVQQGNSPVPTLPQNCAMLVKKKTGLGEKWNVGRMFIPPGYLPEADISNTGAISLAKYAILQGFLTAFYDNLRDSSAVVGSEPTSFQPVLFHNNPGRGPTDITSLVLDAIIATQRQRLRR